MGSLAFQSSSSAGGAVAAGVVVGGVGAHAVGVGLHQGGTVALAGVGERGAGHGQAGQDVVAVHAHAGESVTGGAAVDGERGLPVQGLGDRPLVVLAEEDDGRVVDGGEVERLVGVALAGGSVTEVGDHGAAVLADGAVALDAHRVAGRVQGLAADDDGVQVEPVFVGVPATVGDAAEHAEQFLGFDTPAPGDAVFAVGRERHVAVGERTCGADLSGFLAEQGGPEAQLALALQ